MIELAWAVHRFVYRLSGGRIGTRVGGLPVLELTTTGRKSGEPRRVLLNYREHDRGYVVVASAAGSERPPDWWLNLAATPQARVRRDRRVEDVVPHELEGDERERQWRRMLDANPGYEEYQRSVSRRIPVILLERARSPGGAG